MVFPRFLNKRRRLSFERLEWRWALAAGDLRIVDYNVLGYDGTPSTDIGTVLKAIGDEVYNGRSRPVDVVTIQESQSQATTTASIVSQLNALYGSGRYVSGALNGASTSPNQTVALIYNTQTITLVSEVGVGTVSTSGAARQPIRYMVRPIGVASGNDFYIYNSHYKATGQGTETQDLARRNVEAKTIRQNADALAAGSPIIYAGDYNTKSSTEASFQTLISAGNGQAVDPLNRLGDWSGNATFKDVFSQAPAINPPAGYVGGGLNDRFDFELHSKAWSDGVGMEYVTGSYRTFANNGTVAVNGNINATSNTALSSLPNRSAILDLLMTASDHLPVVVDYEYIDPTPRLTVSLAQSSISENGGSTVATITRNGVTTSPLTVSLVSSNSTAATIVSSVTIPAGSSSITATASGVDDTIADGDQTTLISAQSSGFLQGAASLNVTDDEVATLTVALASHSIVESGGIVKATITRNTPTFTSLTVNVASSDTSAATVPATVTIPTGANSVDFDVMAVDDLIADGDQVSTISVSLNSFLTGTDVLAVMDDEVASLFLTFGLSTIPENGGTTSATIRRNTPTTSALLMSLTNSDPASATIPPSIVIPVGADSATFTINAVDDQVVDGDKTVDIVATANGLASGSNSIQVIDNDVAQLTVTLGAATIPEVGGSVTATVKRNTTTTSSLAVNVSSSINGLVTLPSLISIPAGATFSTFAISANNDNLALGNQTTIIAVGADNFVSGSTSLTVQDDDVARLTLVFANSSINEDGGATTATISRNTSTANDLIVNLASADQSRASVPTAVTIPAGQFSATFTVSAVDDAIAQGNSSVSITSSSGTLNTQKSISIVDDDIASVLLTFADGSISEVNDSTIATVTRNTPVSQPLSVSIASSIAGIVSIPSAVLISIGETTVQFTVASIDNNIAHGDRTATLSASANGLQSSNADLKVVDDDVATLSLSLSKLTVGENGGTSVATVRRNTATNTSLEVSVVTVDGSRISVPNRVTIPAGSDSTTFDVTAIDNEIVEGDQTANLSITSSGLLDGTASLSITEDDVPKLTLHIDPASISETGGIATAVLHRNTSTIGQLIVTISSGDQTEATVPNTVTIAAGQAEVMFEVHAVADGIVDGDKIVTITGTTSGFLIGSFDLTILDADHWSWTNTLNPFDVDDDKSVSPLDVLIVINDLNANGQRTLPPLTARPPNFYDVDADTTISPLDVLVLINYLNSHSGSGEGESSDQAWVDFDALEKTLFRHQASLSLCTP